ncbi:hypothetical protein ONR75_15780 [Rhodopseudomonas sp. P2A-2r]|uniref:hypothetical protein n=1 Tax=Rhodopseudomonas sp. P2A-2r TaxID=2991972 RepID=UPI0022348BAE|nr:hypothetical protein [Rhodopseudomonas sp. P2A-2r]UZE51891.1 hypothetical protein ONR75_15780 [Rhodopseudomonas sp. P2A-2r]
MDNMKAAGCGHGSAAYEKAEQHRTAGASIGGCAASTSYTIGDAIDHKIAECLRTVSELRDLKGSLSLGFLNSAAARVGHLRSLGLFS